MPRRQSYPVLRRTQTALSVCRACGWSKETRTGLRVSPNRAHLPASRIRMREKCGPKTVFSELRTLPLKRLCGGAGQHVGPAVQGRDQPVDVFVVQNRGKFGAARRPFADRTIEIDVGDQPSIA